MDYFTSFMEILLTKIIFTTLNHLDRPSPAGEDGVLEGTLTRKHEWESTTKKASNRSWDKVSEVLHLIRFACEWKFLQIKNFHMDIPVFAKQINID